MAKYPKRVTCPTCNHEAEVEPPDKEVGIMSHNAVCGNEDCPDYLQPIPVEPDDDYTEPMFGE